MENKSSNSQVHEYSIITKEQAENCIRSLIAYIGENPDSEHTISTPSRVIKSYNELFGGYRLTPEESLGTTFETGSYDQMVICKDIEMYSTCAHHMIPFFGKVSIGYIPGKRVVGLSKLARLVEVYSRRLQIQEQLTDQIAGAIDDILKPLGVMVTIDSKHLCMCARGVGKQSSSMVTSSIRGAFKKPEARQEFLNLIGG